MAPTASRGATVDILAQRLKPLECRGLQAAMGKFL